MSPEQPQPEGQFGTTAEEYAKLGRLTGEGFVPEIARHDETPDTETDASEEIADTEEDLTFQGIFDKLGQARSKTRESIASTITALTIEASQVTGLSQHLPETLHQVVTPVAMTIMANAGKDALASRKRYREAQEMAESGADKDNWLEGEDAETEAAYEKERALFGRIAVRLRDARLAANGAMASVGVSISTAAGGVAETLWHNPELTKITLVSSALAAAGGALQVIAARMYRKEARGLAREGAQTFDSSEKEDEKGEIV